MIGKQRDWKSYLDEWSAWYSGDPQRLIEHYANRFDSSDEGKFMAMLDRQERSQIIHVPLAGDIAETSSNLLFGETPDIDYIQEGDDGKRTQQFLEENFIESLLAEAAELCSALGGVYLKLDTRQSLSDVPIVSARTPMNTEPIFQFGRLIGVAFWRIVAKDKRNYWRLAEKRTNENGRLSIKYELYKGTWDKRGEMVALDSLEETANLEEEINASNYQGIGVVYIPNKKPNRIDLDNHQGVADIQGAVTMLDALDEAWTSWLRDIRLGAARIFVDESFISKSNEFGQPNGSAIKQFDVLQEAFVKLNMDDVKFGDGKFEPIHETQFEIRVDEHERTTAGLIKQVVSMSGYSPHTFGMEESGQAESGTALRQRERKSLLTRNKKSSYWVKGITELIQQAGAFSGAFLGRRFETKELAVQLNDSILEDQREASETVRNFAQASAISTYMKVKMANPNWKEDQVQEEVERINKESGMTELTDDEIGD